MKVVILAGGFGTRISEESQFKPKPMIEIGGKPILWHIMNGIPSLVIMSLLSVADTSNRLSRIILPTTICIIVI